MKLISLLILFSLSFNVFGQASNPNDTLKIGKKSSSSDKGIIFETNDGVLNKTLKVNPTSKYLIYSGNDVQMGDGASSNDKQLILDPASGASLKWEGSDNYVEIRNNDFRIGLGSDVDQTLEFDVGLGATNPKIKWDSAKGKFRQSIGGSDKDLGSGSGGGGGENFNNAFTADDNGSAEDGTTGWTASAGTFALETSDPLEGDQSFLWTPSAQNDTLDSPVLDVDKDIFLGRSCQANIEYIGGDENLTLQVVDADNDVLGEEVLQAQTISAVQSVFFLCPNSTATANDKDLKFRILNAGASASALIKFDKAYVGTLIGLSETTLPDVLSVSVQNNGVITVLSDRPDNWYDSITRNSTGNVTIDYTSLGLTSIPGYSLVVDSAATRNAQVLSVSATEMTIRTNESNGTAQDNDFSLTITKHDADAKQSVQVYKSIPKVSENVNEFSIRIGTGGVIEVDDFGIMNGNCSLSSVNNENKSCSFNADIFSQPPIIVGSACNAPQDRNVSIGTITNISFNYTTRIISNSQIDNSACFTVIKNGSDFKLPTVQPIIVGQVQNSMASSANKSVYVEACRAGNTGVSDSLDLCTSWIDSVSNPSTGRLRWTLNSKFANSSISCTCSHRRSYGTADSDKLCSVAYDELTGNATIVETLIEDTGTLSPGNAGVNLNCIIIK